jgi:hypothetical protein
MAATGFALLVFGLVMARVLKPHATVWDARDVFSTLPVFGGVVLLIASMTMFLWGALP